MKTAGERCSLVAVLVTWCLLVSATPVRAQAVPPEARELLARAAAATGVERLRPDAVLREEWQFATPAGCGVSESWVSLADGARLVEVSGDHVRVRTVRAGRYAEQDPQGRITERALAEVAPVCGMLHRMRFDHLHPEQHGARAVLAAPATLDGRDCPAVRFEFADSPPFTMAFDPETFLPVQVQVDDSAQPFTLTLHDPTTLLGVTRPVRAVQLGADGKKMAELLLVDFEVLSPLEPEFFSPRPAPLAGFEPRSSLVGGCIDWAGIDPRSRAPDADASLVERRRRLEALNRGGPMVPFVVDGSLNGRHLRLVLDTGSSRSVVRKSFADYLGLVQEGSEVIETPGGQSAVGRCRAGVLAFPQVAWYHLALRTEEQSPVFGEGGGDDHGVIGMDLLQGLTIHSDPDQHSLLLLRLGAPYPRRNFSVLPLDLSWGTPITRISIDGGPPLNVLLDTGATAPLVVSRPALEMLGYEVRQDELPPLHTMTLGTTMRGGLARLASVRLGDLEVKDLIVEVADGALDPAPAGHARFDGLLGGGLLSTLQFVIDPAGAALLLERAASWRDRMPPTPGLMLELVGEELLVTSVGQGSPAERAGVRPRDRIVNIRGVPLKGTSASDRRRLLSVAEDEHWPLAIERGSETLTVVVTMQVWPPRLTRSARGHGR